MREPDRFSHGDSGEDRHTLLDRARKAAALTAALGAVSKGRGRVVPIEGPVGIGKSRLMAQARASAVARGLRVLSARGSMVEFGDTYGVVRQLVEPVLLGRPRPERLTIGRLLATRAVTEHDTYEMSHELYSLLAALAAEQPLVVTVDDLQWSDRPSLRFLAHLARRIDTLPILLVVALVADESTTDGRLLDAIVRDATMTLRPQPLSDTGVARLLKAHLGAAPDDTFTSACATATGGNPRLLTDLARALRAERVSPESAEAERIDEIGPAAVAGAVLGQVRRYPQETLDVARAVCVLGDMSTLTAVARLAGLDSHAAAEAIRRLVRAGILQPDSPIRFTLPMVRAAIDHDLSPGERTLHHAIAARQLRDHGAPAEQVAPLLLRVEPRSDAWVVDVLDEASRTSVGHGRAEEAIAYLHRALAEPPSASTRARLLHRLGLAELHIDGPSALEHLSAAYRQTACPSDRSAIAACLGRLIVLLGSSQQACDLVRSATLHPETPPDRRLELEAIAAYADHLGGVGARAGRLPRTPAEVSSIGPGAGLLLAVAAWRHALTGASTDTCLSLAGAALDGEQSGAGSVLTAVLAAAVLTLADAQQASATWESIIEDAVRRGASFSLLHAKLWQGLDLLSRGDLVAAEPALRAAVAETGVIDWAAGRWFAGGLLARVLLERGDRAGAGRVLQSCGGQAPGADADAVVSRARIELLLADGRAAWAATATDRCVARLGAITNPAWLPWRSWQAAACARLGRPAEALQLAEEELALARRWGAPGAVGAALRGVAVLLGGRGVPLARLAVEETAGSTSQLERAKALVTLGSCLRRGRFAKDAREPLRQAVDIARPLGAEPVARRALAELSATGGRPHAPLGLGAASLTPSERRVADLAATGASNRDIADALYVTTKTVEVHLSHAYRKLGISARSGLGRALAADPTSA